MGSRMAVEFRRSDEIAYLVLMGSIDEDNDLLELGRQITAREVIINAADVERINSCGVRDWVTWLGELQRKNANVYLVECSPPIMTQVNLVSNFVGAGSIVSFYAPYFCPSCDSEKMLLVQVDQALSQMPFRPPLCRCDQCDQTTEFDDVESSYFAFLSTTTSKPLRPEVAETIKKFSSTGHLRTRSPTATTVAVGTSPSTMSVQVTPTIPNIRDLRSLLTGGPGQQRPPPKKLSSASIILYVTFGLLVVAVVLLSYVALRR